MVTRLLHGVLIACLLGEALYCAHQVFVVLQPEGMSGPVLYAARDLPQDLLVRRRLYAIEGWVAFGALAIYLGVTEVRPRRRD